MSWWIVAGVMYTLYFWFILFYVHYQSFIAIYMTLILNVTLELSSSSHLIYAQGPVSIVLKTTK